MKHGITHRTRTVALATIMIADSASTAIAVDPGAGSGNVLSCERFVTVWV
jgi:hypothetical protein